MGAGIPLQFAIKGIWKTIMEFEKPLQFSSTCPLGHVSTHSLFGILESIYSVKDPFQQLQYRTT